jgi:hypothetical protein
MLVLSGLVAKTPFLSYFEIGGAMSPSAIAEESPSARDESDVVRKVRFFDFG